MAEKAKKVEREMQMHHLFNAYYDLCKGNAYPHVVVLNPAWINVWPKAHCHEPLPSIKKKGRAWFFMDAEVTWSDTEPNFRFEDVR